MKNSKNFREHLNNLSGVSKTIKIFLLAVAFTFSGVLSASTEPTKAEPTKAEPTTAISSEIGKLLKNPGFLVEDDLTAQVKVVINDENELVVLSVDTENIKLESFIKSRLNYKELSVNTTSNQKTFIVPVRITQKG